MTTDKIRYLRFLNGQWRWRPEAYMRAYGFKLTTLGPEKTASVIARAAALNEEWDRVKRGAALAAQSIAIKYPPGTIGDGYTRAMESRAADRAEAGKPQTKDQEKRDDWKRAWKHLERWALYDPTTIQPEHFLAIDPVTGQTVGLIADLNRVSAGERHRTIKVWRALWKRMARLGYCALEADPSKVRPNSAPQPRQAVWMHREVMKLVQGAWRSGKRGLACFIAITWDTMLSPVDARALTLAQMRERSFFTVARAKTGRAALATLSPYSQALLAAYLGPVQPLNDAPIFRTAAANRGRRGAAGGRRCLTPRTSWRRTSPRSAPWCLVPQNAGRCQICAAQAMSRVMLVAPRRSTHQPKWRIRSPSRIDCTRLTTRSTSPRYSASTRRAKSGAAS